MLYEPRNKLLIYLIGDFVDMASIKYCDRCAIDLRKDFPIMPDCIFPIYEGFIIYEFLDCGISRTVFQGPQNINEVWFSRATKEDFELFLEGIARKNLIDKNYLAAIPIEERIAI